MITSSRVSPLTICCPVGARIGQRQTLGADTDEEVDSKMAVLGEPIIGVERVVYDEETGPGALPAKALDSPKPMTAAQRSIHDLTHMPYHPGCEICVGRYAYPRADPIRIIG